jgi:FkbM family methyltransferase
MEKLGTNYGGWYVPNNLNLDKNSIVYSAGVGEDISFDIKLQSRYNCFIYLIDPTLRAQKHYNEICNYYKTNNYLFTGDIQVDYHHHISNENPNFNKIKYLYLGLWDHKNKLKFYKQTNKKYVSQSLIENMFGEDYDEISVNSIKNIMEEYNHKKIDLIKLDIEGAEIKVLNNMLDDNIYPKYILVELDLFLKKKDPDLLSKKLVDRLLSLNYNILYNDNYNITFEKII